MANTIIVPKLFAREVVRNRDLKNVFYNYVNSAFTGELKKAGDTVTVQTLPTLNFAKWVAGDPITNSDFTITSENLVIDNTNQLWIQLKNVEVIQSNLDLETAVAWRFGEAEGRLIDEAVRDTILNATNVNTLNKAAPITLTKDNVYSEIEKMKVVLAENNVTENLVLFVAPKVASVLRQSGLLDNTDTWLAVRTKGYLGIIAWVKIVETNSLTASLEMIMMQEGSVNFVIQLNNYDVRQGTDGFYENLIAEVIYGSKIFDENGKAIVIDYVDTVTQ